MKKLVFGIITTLCFLFIQSTVAQNNIPVGMRIEVAECGSDDNTCSIFYYKDEDSSAAYYMSLGREYNIVYVESSIIGDLSVDHIDEFCLNIGQTADEAIAYLDTLLTIFEMETGTVLEFPCRTATWADKLGEHGVATCFVVKRFLQGKSLCFQFKSGNRIAQTDLSKMAVKSLRLGMKLEKNRKK